RPRPQMDDWFCLGAGIIAGRRIRAEISQKRGRLGVSPVPLRPKDPHSGRLRPPSRLKMNSQGSALTAVLAGLTEADIRAKGDCEGVGIAHNRKSAHTG